MVYCVTQDSKGYLWFGTDAGASRFDGRIFENFTIQDGLSDNEILNIHKDSKGRLWFFTLNGKLSYYFNDTFFNANNDRRLALAKTEFEAISFMEDSDSNIWIGSISSQLFYFGNNGTSRLFNLDTLFTHPANTTRNWVFTYSPSKDRIWIIIGYHASKIFEYKNNNLSAIADQTVIVPQSNLFYLQNTALNTSFYNGHSGICTIVNGKSESSIPISLIPNDKGEYRYFVDRHLNIFTTSSDNTVYHFKKKQGVYSMDYSYFLDSKIGGIWIDSEGNTWFTTTGAGIYKMSPNSEYLKIYPGKSNEGDKSIECVKGDCNGKIWFSTSKGNLYQLNNDSLIKYPIRSDNRGPGIRNFEVGTDGSVYCLTGEGMFLLKNSLEGSYRFIDIPAKNKGVYYTFKQGKFLKTDRHGDLFISSGTGLLQMNNEDGKHYAKYVPFNSQITHRIYSLYFDSYNNFWFENSESLCCYNENELLTYSIGDKDFSSHITGIDGISDSMLVIATYGNGLFFFKNGKVIKRITTSEGLAGNLCRQVFVEKDTVYVSTNQGFTYFTYHNNIISNIKTFTMDEGMPTNDVRFIYALRGKVYVATSSGLCVLDKHFNKQQDHLASPRVYIKSILINGETQTKALFTAPYNARVVVNYTAVTFDQPEKIIYQYRLADTKNAWIDTKNTTAILSSLKPGEYKFSLRAKKYNSDWSTPIGFQLFIIPPYWQQWWFRGLLISLLLITAYYIIKYATARNYRFRLEQAKAQQALAEERNRISSDMHDDLGADLSNILLLTRINSRKNTSEPENKKQLSEIEKFTTSVIGKVDEIIWALNPSQDSLQDLVEYITDYCSQFLSHDFLRGNIIVTNQVPDKSITSVFRRNIFLVIKEGMNNILKHSCATVFRIELKVLSDKFIIQLVDNGNGFINDEKLERGNGLLNMIKRITELKGELNIHSVPGKGTTLDITVPLN